MPKTTQPGFAVRIWGWNIWPVWLGSSRAPVAMLCWSGNSEGEFCQAGRWRKTTSLGFCVCFLDSWWRLPYWKTTHCAKMLWLGSSVSVCAPASSCHGLFLLRGWRGSCRCRCYWVRGRFEAGRRWRWSEVWHQHPQEVSWESLGGSWLPTLLCLLGHCEGEGVQHHGEVDWSCLVPHFLYPSWQAFVRGYHRSNFLGTGSSGGLLVHHGCFHHGGIPWILGTAIPHQEAQRDLAVLSPGESLETRSHFAFSKKHLEKHESWSVYDSSGHSASNMTECSAFCIFQEIGQYVIRLFDESEVVWKDVKVDSLLPIDLGGGHAYEGKPLVYVQPTKEAVSSLALAVLLDLALSFWRDFPLNH